MIFFIQKFKMKKSIKKIKIKILYNKLKIKILFIKVKKNRINHLKLINQISQIIQI